MNKLSITLPAGSQICIESEDAALVREVLYSFMPQLIGTNGASSDASPVKPADVPTHSNGHAGSNGSAQRVPEPQQVPVFAPETNGAPPTAPTVTAIQAAPPSPAPEPEPAPITAVVAETMTPSEHEYIAFCQRVNPLGDMRRVVVAAEAAHRYLNIGSVDPDSLAHLFTLAGWPIPHSFVQTLRNAARTKFRWLERIPGLSGHYKVTNTGRSIVLGEGEVKTEAE